MQVPFLFYGVIKIIKTDVYDGICIIYVNTNDDYSVCLEKIKMIFKNRNIKIWFTHISNIMSNTKNIIIAACENDLLEILSALGCIKEDAKITNYTLRCSCSAVFWEGFLDVSPILKKYKNKICFLCEWGKNGCIICENDIKQKLLGSFS
ncbi:MAG: hypothetical protein J6R68_07325 [Clostridia bacterium]|nr:hypothetical protein [Clostridia bacterium]